MADYCRLCAELKEPSEITASIDDIEQSMDQKLRACCQWTAENTDHRLPHGVCSICLDKLEKCWLFAQGVQLAQQQLLEIFETKFETKPLISELVQTVYDSSEHASDLPPAIAFEIQGVNIEPANFQCNICHQSFKNNRSLREHCKQRHNEKKCEICSLDFPTVDELNAHRQQGCEGLMEISANVEDECNVAADEWNNSPYHSDGNDNAAPFDNDNDDDDFDVKEPKYFKSVADARKAWQKKRNLIKKEVPKKPSKKDAPRWQYRCDECGLPFSKQSNLSRHQAKHNNVMPFECWLCHETFRFRYLLDEHFRLHPLSATQLREWAIAKETKTKTKAGQKRKSHKCKECNRAFIKKSHLDRHERTHTGERNYACELCGARYKEKYNLNAHRLKHSANFNQCWQCQEVFPDRATLKKHLAEHRAERGERIQQRFDCFVCEESFNHRSELNKHRAAAHPNERPFECWACHRVFKYSRLLKFHMKDHVKPKEKKGTCICELCGKVFIHVNFLEDHLTVHYDQRPHKCGICGLGYKTKRLLNSHHISHTDFKHKCTQCDKSYRKKASLAMHMESHTGVINKPFVCDVCSKGFRKNCDLVEHRRIHTGEKPHKCEYCGMNFRTMSGCYTHLRKMHGVSVSARNREEQRRLTAMS